MHGLIGDPLAVGVVLLAAGAAFWHHEHHFQRFTLWLFTAAAACLTIAIPPLEGALAALTTTGPGLTGLLIAAVLFGITWYLVAVKSGRKSKLAGYLQGKLARGSGPGSELVRQAGGTAPRRPRYRRVASPVVAVVSGVIFVLVYGSWRLLLKSAATSAAGALSALAESGQKISSGKAAASVPPSHRPEIYFVAGGALLVFILVLRSIERRRHPAPKAGKGGSPAIQAARGGGAAFGGQRP
jgi:hypothetical protein